MAGNRATVPALRSCLRFVFLRFVEIALSATKDTTIPVEPWEMAHPARPLLPENWLVFPERAKRLGQVRSADWFPIELETRIWSQ